MWFGASAILVRQVAPRAIRPLFALLFGVPYRIYRARCLKFFLPLIRERVEYFSQKKIDSFLDEDELSDLITWLARAVVDSPLASTVTSEVIPENFLFIVSPSHSII